MNRTDEIQVDQFYPARLRLSVPQEGVEPAT